VVAAENPSDVSLHRFRSDSIQNLSKAMTMRLTSYIASMMLAASILGRAATDINVGSGTLNWDVTSIQDATGSTHRKISLVGRPMPDVAPPAKEQSDETPPEPAYVDAFNQRLQYTVNDIYIPLPGGELALSVKRTLEPETWSVRYGLLPFQRPDRPFGLGWATNLVVAIEFTHTINANGAIDYADVTDEHGQTHRFLILTNLINQQEEFLALPSSETEKEDFLNTLKRDGSGWIFKKPHGTELRFASLASTDVARNPVPDDRVGGGGTFSTSYAWARVTQIEDRFGNTLTYHYPGGGTLIPDNIRASTGQDIDISSPGGRITAVYDPMNRTINYAYSSGSVQFGTEYPGGSFVQLNPLTTVDPSNPHYIDLGYKVLESVQRPMGGTVHYTWDVQREVDLAPGERWSRSTRSDYYHCDLKSVSDPRTSSWTYSFEYDWDHSKKVLISGVNPYPITGLPRRLTRIILPNGVDVEFVSEGEVELVGGVTYGALPTYQGTKKLTVTDAIGNATTYKFLEPRTFQISDFKNNMNIGAGFWTHRAPYLVMFKKMVIDHSNGRDEEFEFDPTAAMNLVSAKDFWDNETTFAYEDEWSIYVPHLWLTNPAATNGQIPAGTNGVTVYPYGKYPQATKQTNAKGRDRIFSYDSQYRLPLTAKDEDGRSTVYTRDGQGRVTTETLKALAADGVTWVDKQRIRYEYTSGWSAFVTKKTIETKTLTGGGNEIPINPNDPSWCAPLVTTYVPDNRGRLKKETVDPNGLALVTDYTYDDNNNVRTITNPHKINDTSPKITEFLYDKDNRLIMIKYPGAATKEYTYDLAGNRTGEKNENGKWTYFFYDKFNRLFRKCVEMAGPIGAAQESPMDLITLYGYNNVHSLVSTTDPRGIVTLRGYDRIQRLISLQRADKPATTFKYGLNSGSLTFDGNVFRPTEVKDPKGYVTKTTYDVLGRPDVIRKGYDLDDRTGKTIAFVIDNEYDHVGNLISTTETPAPARTRTTEFEYDFMNRLVKTTHPDTTFKQTLYTSTGLPWKVIDENNHATVTEYDGAGRPTVVRRPTVNEVTCVTVTEYDPNGNIIKVTDPKQRVWSYEFDARNRKTKAIAPLVFDAISSTNKNPTTSFKYDGVGNVTAATDPKGFTTKTEYDAANRPLKVTHPDVLVNGVSTGSKTVTTYDKNGNIIKVISPRKTVTTNEYDVLDKLIVTRQLIEDNKKLVITRTYDAVGNLRTVTDGNRHKTEFRYDGFNRLVETKDPAGQIVTNVYDGTTRTSRKDSLQRQTTYVYDNRDRLIHVQYVNNGTQNLHYGYDFVGNLLHVNHDSDSRLNVVYTYDAQNRVETEESGGLINTYGYDANGNRNSVRYGGTGLLVASDFDALNRLKTVTEGTRITSYFYDRNGNMVRKLLPNNEEALQSFDNWNRVTFIRSGTNDYSFEQQYDLSGNVVKIIEVYTDASWNRVKTMSYDKADRLIEEITSIGATLQTLSYTYDRAGNRTQLMQSTAGP
jgi:YD repeat-containing protein